MKNHVFLKILVVFSAFLMLEFNVAAYNLFGEDPVRGYYQHEGAVVSVPANFAASVVQLGFLGALVPPIAVLDCLYTPFSPNFYSTNFNRHVNDANVFIRDYVRLIGYYPVGFPFYISKKILWDGPRYLVFSIFDMDEYDDLRGFEEIQPPPPEEEKVPIADVTKRIAPNNDGASGKGETKRTPPNEEEGPLPGDAKKIAERME